MSAILEVDVVCGVAMTSTPNSNVISYITNVSTTCYYSFFIYPTSQIRVCTIRFVSTGKNRGNPCLVCKKKPVQYQECCQIKFKKSVILMMLFSLQM